jgi:hypothetical protein
LTSYERALLLGQVIQETPAPAKFRVSLWDAVNAVELFLSVFLGSETLKEVTLILVMMSKWFEKTSVDLGKLGEVTDTSENKVSKGY